MINRMKIIYKSTKPCAVTPAVFSTGSYVVRSSEDEEIVFDFIETIGNYTIEDGYLKVEATNKNLDDSVLGDITKEQFDKIACTLKEEDFIEIFYECYEDEEKFIELTVEKIVLYGSGDFTPIEFLFSEEK